MRKKTQFCSTCFELQLVADSSLLPIAPDDFANDFIFDAQPKVKFLFLPVRGIRRLPPKQNMKHIMPAGNVRPKRLSGESYRVEKKRVQRTLVQLNGLQLSWIPCSWRLDFFLCLNTR